MLSFQIKDMEFTGGNCYIVNYTICCTIVLRETQLNSTAKIYRWIKHA
jgi:hypothetical protein